MAFNTKGPTISVAVRCVLLALVSGLPAVVTALYFIIVSTMEFGNKWGLLVLILLFWVCASAKCGYDVHASFEKVAGLLGSFRAGEFTVRVSGPSTGDAYADCIFTLNILGQQLSSTRQHSAEVGLLLEAISEEIDASIFLVAQGGTISWLNRTGALLLKGSRVSLVGKLIQDVGLNSFLHSAQDQAEAMTPNTKRWEVKEKMIYDGGYPHRLIVVADITRSLREEERLAWRRMARVLGHEINNSLTPLKTLSSELAEMMDYIPRPADLDDDVKIGLTRIAKRADRLGRFISGYSRLMNMPPPIKKKISLGELLRHVASLERGILVRLREGPTVYVSVDEGQLEQALINILKNAVEATAEAGGSAVELLWRINGDVVLTSITDEGVGLGNNHNLFVPFYTTKPNGSGIGLVLSREIIEAHSGRLTLRNRTDGSGCEALIELPL